MTMCNLRALVRWHLVLGVLSILADATEVPTPDSRTSIAATTVAVTTHSPLITKPTGEPVHTSDSGLAQLSSSTLHMQAETSSLGIPSTLAETNQTDTSVSSQSPVTLENLTTQTSKPNITDQVIQYGGNKTTTMPESTTTILPSPSSTTRKYSSTIRSTTISVGASSLPTTAAPSSIKCMGLRDLASTTEVVCLQYPEDISCETVDEETKGELKTFLCGIINATECHVTILSSEVEPKCILWVPPSEAAEDKIMGSSNPIHDKISVAIKRGQISDHQTRSQKTMIALVTCGVLLAAFILAGYFLSNRESWSPGRQRLGEDPYYTETDSQGNTLVSVSAHGQDKANSATRENGMGQTATPAATNGHSTKKQPVSDTEL